MSKPLFNTSATHCNTLIFNTSDSTHHIEQTALTLRAEGVILLQPVEWDGRLGREEQRVIDRLFVCV